MNVLFGALAEASWHGTELILRRLGAARVAEPTARSQAECVWVASMVPRQGHREAIERFSARSRDLFSDNYYASTDAEDGFWTLDDLEDVDAPHVPVAVLYEPILADFPNLSDVAHDLLELSPYKDLVERVRTCRNRL